jgi:hypothetical protein
MDKVKVLNKYLKFSTSIHYHYEWLVIRIYELDGRKTVSINQFYYYRDAKADFKHENEYIEKSGFLRLENFWASSSGLWLKAGVIGNKLILPW